MARCDTPTFEQSVMAVINLDLEAAGSSFDDFLEGLGASHSTPLGTAEGGDRPYSTISSATPSLATSGINGSIRNLSGRQRGDRPPTAYSAWRSHSTGLLYLMMEQMMSAGSPCLSPRALDQLHQMTPPLGTNVDMIPVMLVTIHTVISTPGVREIMQTWNVRQRVVVPAVQPTNGRRPGGPSPRGQPLEWDFGTWSLAVQVLLRFTNQSLPATEMDFLHLVRDIVVEAGMNGWTVEVIVHTLYFIQAANWAWETLFDA